MTRQGRVLGIPEYMSPEQALDKKVRLHASPILVTGTSVDSRYLATVDTERHVRLWDTSNLSLVGGFVEQSQEEIASLAVDANADFVALEFRNSGIQLWKRTR